MVTRERVFSAALPLVWLASSWVWEGQRYCQSEEQEQDLSLKLGYHGLSLSNGNSRPEEGGEEQKHGGW